MSDSAPIDAPETAPRRGPGRPPGYPKTGGRPKGSRNKATKEVKALLQPQVPKAKKRLRELVGHDDPEIALKAVQLVLAYTYGKPTDRKEISGSDGGPALVALLQGFQ